MALGNDFTAQGVGQPVHVTAAQTLSNNAEAISGLTVDGYSGPIAAATASATGNSATVAVSGGGDASGSVQQTVTPNWS